MEKNPTPLGLEPRIFRTGIWCSSIKPQGLNTFLLFFRFIINKNYKLLSNKNSYDVQIFINENIIIMDPKNGIMKYFRLPINSKNNNERN